MTRERILLERDGGVAVVTWNRPRQRNAFDQRMWSEGRDVLRELLDDGAVRAVVVTGAGEAFSAGQDLGEMTTADGEHAFPGFMECLCAFDKPLVAAVNGVGVGIGLTMLLHCDVVLVSELARLRAPFTRMGVAPEAASSFLLPRRMGRQRAALALFTSDWIAPQDAVDAGLAVQVCPADRLVSDAVEIATRIAEHPLPSLMETKRLVIDAERVNIARAKELEGAAFARLLSIPDARGRVAAQLDKGPR